MVPPAQRPLRARLILAANAKMGLDGTATGEKDRLPGIDLGKREPRIIERAGTRIGIFSLDLDALKDPLPALHDPPAALRKQGAQLVIALVHGGLPRVRELLKPGGFGIDVAVVSHTAIGTSTPEHAGDTWIVEAAAQGKQLGELDLHILDGKLTFDDVGLRSQLEAQVWDQQQEVADLRSRAETADANVRVFYEQRKRQIEGMLDVERRTLASLPVEARGSWLENKQIPMGTEVADEPAIAELVRAYKVEVAKLAPPPVALAAGGQAGFAGTDACLACHPAQVAFWKKSKHAHAMAALRKTHQDRDGSCTGCHVTGNLLGLADVQCEAYHGPAARHIAQPTLKGLVVRDPPEQTCTTCHTRERSTEWHFAEYRAAIIGPGHGRK